MFMSKTIPQAVLISDVHYNVHTLLLADAAMRQAIAKANELNVPLIVAGDLHDTKANMRAECVNAMLETFALCTIPPYILVGNHCRINEKSPAHSLNFLRELAIIVDEPMDMPLTDAHGIPYYNDSNELRAYLKTLSKGARIIMHQGLNGSESGEYIQDKSALNYEDVQDFRVISGHYHKRQDIKTGRPQKGAVGLFSYIGNPYTLGFGEANDPEKGFQILMEDGTLEFVPTRLRRHRIFNIDPLGTLGHQITGKTPIEDVRKGDLVWIKYTATKEHLLTVNKSNLGKALDLFDDFRLDLVPLHTEIGNNTLNSNTVPQHELLDTLIDSMSNTSDERKTRLKELWKKASCG